MKKQLVIVSLFAVMMTAVEVNAWGRRGGACGTEACAPKCAPACKKACVDTICTKEIVNVPATQEVTRVVRTETSVGAIQCESTDCEAQHRAVTPDGGFADGSNTKAQVVDTKKARRILNK